MINIDKLGNISLARGDCGEWAMPIYYGKKDNNIRYEIEDDDVIDFIVFDVGNRYNEHIIEKRYTKENVDEYGRLILSLEEEDTAYLPVHGFYYFVRLYKKDADGTIKPYTLTNKLRFDIEM